MSSVIIIFALVDDVDIARRLDQTKFPSAHPSFGRVIESVDVSLFISCSIRAGNTRSRAEQPYRVFRVIHRQLPAGQDPREGYTDSFAMPAAERFEFFAGYGSPSTGC